MVVRMGKARTRPDVGVQQALALQVVPQQGFACLSSEHEATIVGSDHGVSPDVRDPRGFIGLRGWPHTHEIGNGAGLSQHLF